MLSVKFYPVRIRGLIQHKAINQARAPRNEPSSGPKNQAETMKSTSHTIDFSTILAAAVHDMKNSLQLQLQKLEQVAALVTDADASQSLADIHYEAQRLNAGLIQLLNLYCHENEHLSLQRELQYIDELIEEIIAGTEFYAHHYKIQIRCEVADDLSWYLDKQLISILLQDVIINAVRYAQRRVSIRAFSEHGQLVIEVQDDGDGYPASILENVNQGLFGPQGVTLASGRTGLGLYFAQRIAASHCRPASGSAPTAHATVPPTPLVQGSVALANCNGGNFTLRLP